MTDTLFIRLLHHEDKGGILAGRIAALREDRADDDVYAVNPESFRQVPNTPFCYWVSQRIRRLFKELPPFESDGRTVKQGLATADDFRFVRSWWEVPAERILDCAQYAEAGEEKWTDEPIREFQAWCRKRTCEGKRWVPFAKGGEYSPYYADIHLVVNWENEGAEIRNFIDLKTGKTSSRPQNLNYYFRPGLTWGDRTSSFLSVKPWPAGGVFSVKGSAGFFEAEEIMFVLGLMNTRAFNWFLEMLVNAGSAVSRSYQVGVISLVPYPTASGVRRQRASFLAHRGWSLKWTLDTVNETSYAFLLTPALLDRCGHLNPPGSQREVAAIQEEIDAIIFDLYSFSDADCKALQRMSAGGGTRGEYVIQDGSKARNDDKFAVSGTSPTERMCEVLSWCMGLTFGRWDIRIVLDRSLTPKLPDPFDPLPVCPPGMLVGPDGLPAKSNRIVSEEWLRTRPDANTLPPEGTVKKTIIPDSEYPLRISWDGVLVDDPGFNGGQPHREDIVRRVREVLDILWKDKAYEIEQEACDILGVSDLHDYFRKPAGFFQDHLKRYSKSRRKAPIYWPLSTASGAYTIWLYYHRLTDQTLYTAVNKYVEPKITEVGKVVGGMQNAVEAREGGITDNLPSAYCALSTGQLRDRLNESQTFIGELRQLREELLRIAALPYKPNLNDGVIINAAPLHNLFRLRSWANDTKKVWGKLEKGDYDWAHLAYTIQPDRVREVCRKDRSIAIAHGLEDICEVESAAREKKKSV